MSDTVPLGLTLEEITCPACLGAGTRLIDTGGPTKVEYTCEPCRGLGLLHPKRRAVILTRLAEAKS